MKLSEYQKWRLETVDKTEWEDMYNYLSVFVDKSKKIVELGCGCFGLANFLIERGYRNITGVDKDGTIYECVPKKYHDRVIIMDLEENNPPEAEVYISQHLLEHLEFKRAKELCKWMYKKAEIQIHILPGHYAKDPTHKVNHYTLKEFREVIGYVKPRYYYVWPDTIGLRDRNNLDWVFIMSEVIDVGTEVYSGFL